MADKESIKEPKTKSKIRLLEELGLTGNEAKVYIALLELGSSPAGKLIKKVGMHRAAVYDLMDLLSEKGLVSYVIKANRKYFEAQDPERLLGYIEESRDEIDRKELDLKQILPDLQMMRKLATEEQEGNIYKGKKGLKSIYEDVLKTGETFYVFGAMGRFKEIYPEYFPHFHNRRIKKGITLKIIYNENVRGERKGQELKLSEVRYLPQEYITPATTYIYGEKVGIVLYSKEPMAFLMRSKGVADSYKTFFDLLWGIARE